MPSKHSLLFCLLFVCLSLGAQPVQQHRAVVLTDIEADPDDSQSLIRLLLYANEIDIEGLIATTSVHQKTRVAPETIHKIIDTYGQVQPNLLLHAPGYPTAADLHACVRQGLPEYGMVGVGPGKNSPGSDWIIHLLDQKDERPLWISVWGGANTLAQALFHLRETRSKPEMQRLIRQLRVYTISDQDDSGSWIRKNFPELFYIVSPGGYFGATWIGMSQVVAGIDNTTISNPWLASHIQQNHGPLGAMYPDVGYGMEGDTPAWLSLIPNGLNEPEFPNWGGWGGRYERYLPLQADTDPKGFTGGVPVEPETRPIWTNAIDTYSPTLPNAYGRTVRKDSLSFSNNKVTLWRWRDDFQNDFAARMDWTFLPYAGANHPPVAALGHPHEIRVKAGETFVLDASGSSDPDGDNLSYLWIPYPEAGTLMEPFAFLNAENLYRLQVRTPEVGKEGTTHFILRVTDKGSPALSRYQRVRVYVEPK